MKQSLSNPDGAPRFSAIHRSVSWLRLSMTSTGRPGSPGDCTGDVPASRGSLVYAEAESGTSPVRLLK